MFTIIFLLLFLLVFSLQIIILYIQYLENLFKYEKDTFSAKDLINIQIYNSNKTILILIKIQVLTYLALTEFIRTLFNFKRHFSTGENIVRTFNLW